MAGPNINLNDIDNIYGTATQQEFARKMAESLLRREAPKDARHWTQGVAYMLQALQGAQYRDIAGSQDNKNARNIAGVPEMPAADVGRPVLNPAYKPDIGAIKPPEEIPGVVLDKTNTPPPLKPTIYEKNAGVNPARTELSPGAAKYIEQVKQFENAPLLKNPKANSPAFWDYAQFTNGFGTKAKHKGEVIGFEEANNRFNAEFNKSLNLVSATYPNLPEGTKYALADLTFNAGPSWMKQRLGKAVAENDEPNIKKYFNAYINAGGKPLKALADRRAIASKWIGQDSPGEVPEELAKAPLEPFKPEIAKGVAPDLAGRMNLGFPPKPEDGTPAPIEQAQSRIMPPQNMAQEPGKPQYPIESLPGDYVGPLPDVKPVMTQQQLLATLNATSPENRGAVLQKYHESLAPYKQDASGGYFMITPSAIPGERPRVKFFQKPEDTNLSIGGITAPMRESMTPEGKRIGNFALPGMSNEDAWNKLGEITQKSNKIAAEGKAEGDLIGVKSDAVKSAMGNYFSAKKPLQHINALSAATEAGGAGTPRGPTKDWFMNARRVIDNFLPGVGSAIPGTNQGEVIEKLNGVLAAEATKAFTPRGTNFDLQTFMAANPGLNTTFKGSQMLSDLMRQAYQQDIDLGEKAAALKGDEVGKWPEITKKFYKENPLTMEHPSGGRIYLSKFGSKDEMERIVPKGGWFLSKTGELLKRHK